MSSAFCSIESLIDAERTGVLSAGGRVASKHITSDMMVMTKDWIWTLSTSLDNRVETTFASVNIFNAYISRDSIVKKSQIHGIACACVTLAAKYNEVKVVLLKDYVAATKSITADEIIDFERRIFYILGCNINIPIETNYLRTIGLYHDISADTKNKCYVALMLLSIRTVNFLPSVVVTTILALLTGGESYYDNFEINPDTLRECTNDIIDALRELKSSDLLCSGAFSPDNDNFLSDIIGLDKQDLDDLPDEKYYRSWYFKEDLRIRLVDTSNIVGDQLGEGAYGVVNKVKYNGKNYALKTIRSGEDEGLSYSFLREVSVCMSLNHNNVIKPRYINKYLDGLLLDVALGDLKAWAQLISDKLVRDTTQFNLADQMFSALKYIHNEGCLHRDIKPKNILVFPDGKNFRFVLADFGLARGTEIPLRDNSYTTEVITLHYRPPELLLGAKRYSPAVDIWSMGCTLYEFATLHILFNGDSETDQIMKIFSIMGSPTKNTWRKALSLPKFHTTTYKSGKPDFFKNKSLLSPLYKLILPLCLVMNPRNRATAENIYDDVIYPWDL
jgi:hypothetical protein